MRSPCAPTPCRDRSRPLLSDPARNVAECYLPEDKQMILGVIETGIGSVDAFNQLVRKAFANPGKAETGQKRFSMRSPSQAIVIGMERGASAGVSLGRRSSRDSGRRPSI